MQQFGRLDEAGLVGLLQHLLSVSHEAAVLQHALVLLHLSPQTLHPQTPALLDAALHLRPALLKRLQQTLEVFVSTSLGELTVLLRSERGTI